MWEYVQALGLLEISLNLLEKFREGELFLNENIWVQKQQE